MNATRIRRGMAALAALLALAACEDDAATPAPLPELNAFPAPGWWTEGPDGVRLTMPAVPAIRNHLGTVVDLGDELAAFDGFSPVQPVLLRTVDGCPELPQPGDEAHSLSDASPVLLYDAATGERLPWFGEPADDPAWCELFPLAPWSDGATAWVVVTDAFAAALAPGHGLGTHPAGLPLGVNLPPGRVLAHLQFPIGTAAPRVGPLFALRDATLRWADARRGALLLDVRPAPEAPDDPVALAWKGTFRVPDWTDADGLVRFDATGAPILQGETTEQFFAIAATTATAPTTPLELVQYGHGLFGDPREPFYASQRELERQSAALFAAVPWGMAVRYFGSAAQALVDPNGVTVLRDRVWQGMLNQVLFTRVLRDELGPQAAAALGRPASDVVDYVGISQGGILGGVLAALSPDLRRMVLHVGGGGWTAMMTHSSNWRDPGGFGYGDVVDATVPDAMQRTLLLALWEPLWDQWDPAVYAPYWRTAPPGTAWAPPADRRIHYPYAIDDPQVPNFSSETVLRAAGAPLWTPAVVAPDELATVADAAGAAVVGAQWDVGGGEAAHADVRCLPAFAAQVAAFLDTGALDDTCGGEPCVFAPNPPSCSTP